MGKRSSKSFSGVIASATVASLVLLGTSAMRNSESFLRSSQALENARTCAEHTLYSLRTNPDYSGDETLTFDDGHCTVHPISGWSIEDRGFCIEGIEESAVRRLYVHIDTMIPSFQISTWNEILSTDECPT